MSVEPQRCESASRSHERSPTHVRPSSHEIVVRRTELGNGLWTTVQHITPAGPVVRLELRSDDENVVSADISRAEQESLQFQVGDRLYVMPRRLQVFLED